jgi:hypothetical protein
MDQETGRGLLKEQFFRGYRAGLAPLYTESL